VCAARGIVPGSRPFLQVTCYFFTSL